MSFLVNTDRLILKVEDDSKAEKVLDFYIENRPYFEPYEPTRPNAFYTLEFQQAAIKYEYDDTVKGHSLRYYLYLKDSPDTMIGTINFFNIRPMPFSTASIGYKLHHDYWGRGYATEACQAAISVMFTDYNTHRIEAKVSPENTRSIHVLDRLGFTYEGIEYKSVNVEGIFKDHIRFSLINNDHRS
jgi:ribosomal-protein-alanine N-acetyltransferase